MQNLDCKYPTNYDINRHGFPDQISDVLFPQGWLTTVLCPARLLNSYIMGLHLGMRSRYLKKQKQG